MRALPMLLILALLLPASAAAQEDACSQSAPCPWSLDIDEDGIVGDSIVATVDDWYVLDLLNFDTQEHTLTLEGHDVEVTLAAGGSATSDPFQLDTPGTFSLEDQPTGDFVLLEVRETDVVDDQTGDEDEGGDGENTPLPLAAGLVAVAAAAVLRRR